MGHHTRILVIDDEGLMRDGLCALLCAEDGFELVGAINNSVEAIRVASVNTPDVAIMDFSVVTRNGPEAVAAVRKRWPTAHIITLTFRKDDRLVDAALHTGIEGYVLKTDSRASLMSAIRSVSEGKRYITPSIVGRVVNGFVRNHDPQQKRTGPDTLTDRERDVMKRIAAGYRTREIAQQLSLSHKTIEKHRSNLMRKLGLRSATAVAAYAIAHGYLEL
jgi:two-component system, NarL family, response regulator NreC